MPNLAGINPAPDIEKDTSKVLHRVTFAQRQSKSTKNRFATGDVLYGKLRPYLNKVVRADQDGFSTTEIVPLAPSELVDTGYLFYWLKHPTFLEYVTAVSHGLNMPRLGTEAGRDAPFVLAPIKEQKRIADKLDAVLARVDACRERLDRVPAILKRFRQSVLAAATSGKLTEDWRTTAQVKTSSKELLAQLRSQTGQLKQNEIHPRFTNPFPDGWTWAQVKDVGEVQLGRQRSPKYHSGANMRPYLRVMNVKEGFIDTDDVMKMVFDEADFERYELRSGDILLNEGQSLELIGRPAIYKGEVPGVCFTNTLVRFRAHAGLAPDFAFIVFLDQMKTGRFQEIAKRTVNIAHLGSGRFSDLEFPLPPVVDQPGAR